MNDTTMTSDLHRVGAGLSVRFTFAAERFDAEWQPRCPTKREWKRVIDACRAARHLFLAELARRMGRPVLVVEA
jgi:hypothetical protein